ncbi:MAG: hypothetical protein IKP73_06405 [Bacteroidales bacterium]|nr:hypothetical protein [Bacteroidales bacterium]
MNLNQAIQKIIDDNGDEILERTPFMGLLSYYNAFCQLPYAESMLTQMYEKGYGIKIHELYCNKNETEVAEFILEMQDKFGFDVKKLENVLYAFSLPVQRHNNKKKKFKRHQNFKTSETGIDDEQPDPISSNCKITANHINYRDTYVDNEDVISRGGCLYIHNIKYICIFFNIYYDSWEFQDDVYLEVRLQTANKNRKVWNRYITLDPGRNKYHTMCFGDGSGAYFGIGKSDFSFFINNNFVCTYSIDVVEKSTGFLDFLFN